MKTRLPEFRGDDPVEALLNFYEDLGWDRNSNLNPTKIVVNTKDWHQMCGEFMNMVPDEDRPSAGFLFMNNGPSGTNDVPEGTVVIEDGWIQPQ